MAKPIKNGHLAALVLAALVAAGSLPLMSTEPAEAAFPGANGEIAFVSDRDGDRDIYAMNQSGTGLRRLTNDPKEDRGPAWSPDGSKMAFMRSEVSNDTLIDSEIWVMNADGSAQRRLTAPNVGFDPAWSPDGSKIAFEGDNGPTSGTAIWVMNADGTEQRRVSNLGGGSQAINPAWSPDGSKIAFSTDLDGSFRDFDIYTINPDGSGLNRLTDDPAFDLYPAWSPDGRKIAFSNERYDLGNDPDEENYEVYTMNADGSGRTRLTNSPAGDFVGNWSPNGVKITYSSYDYASRNNEIYLMAASGDGTPVNLTRNRAYDGGPDWQPLVPQLLIPNPNALTIDWRDVLIIPGRLLLGPGNPMPGQRVHLEERPSGLEVFAPVPGAEATTAEDGSFRFEKVQPNENTEYRARFDGDAAKGIPPAMSPIKAVDVRVLLSLSLSTNKVRQGKAIVVSGKVQPTHTGQVTLTVRRDGNTVARESAKLDNDSRYSLDYEPPRTGTYTVVAGFPADEDHAGDTSPKRSFEVVR
jgi:Tol biopolymer transport system component